jgi:hypothetical protein
MIRAGEFHNPGWFWKWARDKPGGFFQIVERRATEPA